MKQSSYGNRLNTNVIILEASVEKLFKVLGFMFGILTKFTSNSSKTPTNMFKYQHGTENSSWQVLETILK